VDPERSIVVRIADQAAEGNGADPPPADGLVPIDPRAGRLAGARPGRCEVTTRVELKPVDRIEILSVVDNVFDLLLTSTDVAKRVGPTSLDGGQVPTLEAPLLTSGRAADTPVAEHGLSFLVSVTSGDTRRTVLFDTGATVGGLVHNLRVLSVDPGDIEAVVLSHGHFDHTTGLGELAEWLRPPPSLIAHPDVWLNRRIAVPGRDAFELPTLSEEKVRAAGFDVTSTREPLPLLDGGLVTTGEIARTTEFERGLPVHQALRDGEWQPDPLLQDDQALVAEVRGKGLVVITGCAHAGVVNTVRHAQELTGVDRIHAVMGGFHLAGPVFEPIIEPTVEALREFAPDVVVPAHCTGWRATHALAAAFGDAFVPGSVGTVFVFEGGDG
jgi:7,8-dihydropterin-6-yl-methyl-4-(beta-D-ribofuranosyl)aminobenzene 5'-phosphate synthase